VKDETAFKELRLAPESLDAMRLWPMCGAMQLRLRGAF
jgi:hypothetical protein